MAAEQPSRSSRRRSTSTSDFGVGRREGHDATDFYARFSPPVISDDDDVSDGDVRAIDRVVHGSAADMADVPDGSVALVVTSPPYFAGKAYETELDADHVPSTYLEYLEMLRSVFAECVRTLEPGGRIAVNVANLGRRPYRSLSADITAILQDDLRLLLRGEIVWVKQRGASGSCAWGSFQRAANPVLRDLTERVVVASKGRFDRAVPQKERAERKLPNLSTMYRDEFMDSTLDLWEIAPESARRVGHPAPFPVALPERLINLYTYAGDLVLDPFMGSGTTGVAAVRTQRHFVGYDTDADYVQRANERIQLAQQEGPVPPSMYVSGSPDGPRLPNDPDPESDFQRRAVEDGQAAKDLAAEMLVEAGFVEIEAKAKIAGVDVNFVARDSRGRRVAFGVSGAFRSSRPGLQRTETLWKELGRAAALDLLTARDGEQDPVTDIVLMSTDLPSRKSAGGRALVAAVATDGPLTEVVAMDQAGLDVLVQLASGLRPGADGWSGGAFASKDR